MNLHERSAEQRDEDHRHPGRHLRESPQNVSQRNSKTKLGDLAVEWMPEALIRLSLLIFLINDKLLESIGGSRGAVQLDVANSGSGRRLISQRLGNAEVVDRRRADRPGVAKNRLIITVHNSEFWRVGLRRVEGRKLLARVSTGIFDMKYTVKRECNYLRSTPWWRCRRIHNM